MCWGSCPFRTIRGARNLLLSVMSPEIPQATLLDTWGHEMVMFATCISSDEVKSIEDVVSIKTLDNSDGVSDPPGPLGLEDQFEG